MGGIPWAALPFQAHLRAKAPILTSFRRKPEQLFPPPRPVLPASLASQLALGPGASVFLSHHPPSLCYFARTSPSTRSLVALQPHSCVYAVQMSFFFLFLFLFLNTRVPNRPGSSEIWVRGEEESAQGKMRFSFRFLRKSVDANLPGQGTDPSGGASAGCVRWNLNLRDPPHTHQKRPSETGQASRVRPPGMNAFP